ncbi:MAG: hypothetical protein ACXIUM_11915 [Wenzhouxiangella sp.]
MNIRPSNKITLGLSMALIGSTLLTAAWAEAISDLPDARALIDRHIEAIGGRDAVASQTDSLMRGEFSMPAVGMSGELLIATRASGDYLMHIELPGVGAIRSGVSPEAAWSIDPFSGPRLLEGEELDAMIERLQPGAVLRDPEYVLEARTVEKTEMGGQTCFRVELQWRSGRTTSDCYAVDSGLLIALQSREASPMGEVESLSLLSDYQPFGKVLIPSTTRVFVMGQEQVMVLSDYEPGPVDEALFELPAPIRTLLEDA